MAHAYTWYAYTIMALRSPHSRFHIYGFHTVLYRCLHMVCIYYNGIEIPSFQISHIRFYTVPVRFFTDAHTWYAYTIMALRSPHSRFRIYGSHTVLYRCLHMVCNTIMALRPLIPNFAHMVGSMQFPYGSLQMPTHGMHML